jgi:hypothetical protein
MLSLFVIRYPDPSVVIVTLCKLFFHLAAIQDLLKFPDAALRRRRPGNQSTLPNKFFATFIFAYAPLDPSWHFRFVGHTCSVL